MSDRTQQRVDVYYRLAGPVGSYTADTHRRTWFFDLPLDRENLDAWEELLHRMFYDTNTILRRREPRDESWLALDHFRVSPVDAEHMLAWDGAVTQANAESHLPWILAHANVVWEFAACYFIDDTGAYDVMTGNDFSELVLYRALEEGRTTEASARSFLDKLYPGKGDTTFAQWELRLRNLLGVRPTGAFRKPPNSRPQASGPVREADLQYY